MFWKYFSWNVLHFFQIIAYCDRHFIPKSVGAREEQEEKSLPCVFQLSLFQRSSSGAFNLELSWGPKQGRGTYSLKLGCRDIQNTLRALSEG